MQSHPHHGKVIPFEQLHTIPRRKALLDATAVKEVSTKLGRYEPVLFLPTYLSESISVQTEKYKPVTYKIVLMGILQDGRRINVVIKDIQPYFEVRIPNSVNNEIAIVEDGVRKKITVDEYISGIFDVLNEPYVCASGKPSKTNIKPVRYEKITAKPFKYWQKNKCWFMRFYYDKLTDRRAAINSVRDYGYETTSDDLNNYYRVVCRDHLTTFSSWVLLKNYTQESYPVLVGDTYLISINDFRPYEPEPGETLAYLLKDNTISACWDLETFSPSGEVPQPEFLDHEIQCCGMTFQHTSDKEPMLKIALCKLPAEPHPDYLTVVCRTEANIILAFATVLSYIQPEYIIGFNDADYDWNWIVSRASHYNYTCQNSKLGIYKYVLNQDITEDNNLLMEVVKRMTVVKPFYGYKLDGILKWNFRKENIKLEASTVMESKTLALDGYINIDVRIVFRRLYKTAEQSSLKFFLESNQLDGKEDMPYSKMHNIYAEFNTLANSGFADDGIDLAIDDKDEKYAKLKSDNAEINKYCIVDARRCHDLLKKKNIIMDNKEACNMFYCSIFDGLYRADGMKVRNLTIAIGQQKPFNIRFSNIGLDKSSSAKYPGAHVFPPKKGLNISKLSILERIEKAHMTTHTDIPAEQEWLDTSTETIQEYYDTIEQFGPFITEDKIPEVKQYYQEVNNKQCPDHFIKFMTEPMGRPVTGLDFAALYPSLIRAYNLSPEYCILNQKLAQRLEESGEKLTKVDFVFGGERRIAWFVWHYNKISIDDPEFQFGVYPYILNKLSQNRNEVKKEFKPLGHELELIHTRLKKDATYSVDAETYDNMIFRYNYLNSKQQAIKIFMNTFYGETGNQISPFFVLEVAGGITSYGQRSIKMAHQYILDKQCITYYGDTDSIYLSVPETSFQQFDKQYYVGKINKISYWTKMVETTFEVIKPINQGVNDMFEEDNGTKFLSMAYEEVLFPVIFTAKKKYFGIPHEKVANFEPKELFIKGLDVKKRGVSNILKSIFNELMWSSVAYHNYYTLMELAMFKIKEIYDTEWGINDFIQTGVYNPNKNNVKVVTFVKRMEDIGIKIPPHERFEYVIVKKYPYYYDYRGRKTDISIGDKMELLTELEKYNHEIDLDYYMSHSINGQLARLVVYHGMFYVKPKDFTPEEIDISDKKSYLNACKYISNHCKQYYTQYNTVGKTYQQLYKQADRYIGASIARKNNLAYGIISSSIKEDECSISGDKFINWLFSLVDKRAKKESKVFGLEWYKSVMTGISKENKHANCKILCKLYYGNRNQSIRYIRGVWFDNEINRIRGILNKKCTQFIKIFEMYQKGIGVICSAIKEQIGVDDAVFLPVSKEVQARNITIKEFSTIQDENEIKNKAKQYADDMLNNQMANDLKLLSVVYCDLLTAYTSIRQTDSIVEKLKIESDKLVGHIARPDDAMIKEIILSTKHEDFKRMNELPL